VGDTRPTRDGAASGNGKGNSGRRREWEDTIPTRDREWEDTRPTLEGTESGRTQGQLGKAQGVGRHKAKSGRRREWENTSHNADSGRRREWEDTDQLRWRRSGMTRLTREGAVRGRTQGRLGNAQGVGGHKTTLEGAGSGRTQAN
jgi:hypothetical protein